MPVDKEELTTSFAPPERLTLDQVRIQRDKILRFPFIKMVVDMSPSLLMILNLERQIVFVNKALLGFLGVTDIERILSLRPGEALHCAHAGAERAGCGTTQFCEMCGIVNAILESQKGLEAVNECQVLQQNGDALDLEVWAAPFELEEDTFTFFYILDKSGEKRRRSLERIFFHDVMNTIGGLYGYADLLVESVPHDDQASAFAKSIFSMTESVIEDVQAQKDLTAAENNELVCKLVEIDSRNIINEVATWYRGHEVAKRKEISVSSDSNSTMLKSDRTLLKRVIGNMTKNALEASKPGEKVVLSCVDMDDSVLFTVSNPAFMPREAQLQVFKRSFSTKGAGRGLGTYSIKLLTERYLKGEVSFATSEKEGTTFMISIPKGM
jgi:K+-sensing histidine kinase KdpD